MQGLLTRHRDLFDQALDQRLDRFPLAPLQVALGDHPMGKHRHGQTLHVVRNHELPTLDQERKRLKFLAELHQMGAAAQLVRPQPLGLRLSIDPSTEPLIPAGDPGVEVYRRAVRDFGDDQIFVIAMRCEDVFRTESLAALRRVSDSISRITGVRSVKSLVEVTSFRYVSDEGWIEVRPFIEEIPTDPEALAALRERALADPLYRYTLVSEDAGTAALDVSFRSMTDLEFIAADIDGRIQAILEAETTDGRRFHVSGRPHIKSRMYHAMPHDLALLIPVALANSFTSTPAEFQ